MSVPTVTSVRTRTAEPADRLMRGSSQVSFKEVLAALQQASGNANPLPMAAQMAILSPQAGRIAVRQGDCLSRICVQQLKANGSTASPRAINAAVQEVARINHLADPNRIFTGQTLDLSALPGSASTGGVPNASTNPAIPATPMPWKSLIEGPATLTSGFGLRVDPFTGHRNQHQGIDVAAPAGASIRAFAAGRVIFSGWKPGYGNTVIIRHEDGMESLHAHASRLLVQVGDQVERDTPIGRVGSTGRSTGAHLHFEVRRNGQALNPVALMRGDSIQMA